jgi:uncharacterized BrkB/YihY/UPF0761 family membrane protein
MMSLLSTLSAPIVASAGGGILYGLVSFALWVVIMVWIYTIAKRKGRHAVGWLILGFFFSLITLIVILLLPSKRTTEEYQNR